uniref:hypothetical protein n=1 Tax=Hafnia alvei TaxID=569 RepID=UPI0026EEF0A1|nr:hypothetical protein [Hafnia alvei]
MSDLLMESLALQRIDLIARMVIANQCNGDDKELAMVWIAEMTTQLIVKLDEYDEQEHRRVSEPYQ